MASAAHPSLLTGDGQVEQDPADWWESAAGCLREVTRQAGPAPLAVGLSGQMDGPVLLGGDGQVLGTCHIWADSRATAECGQITGLIGAGQLIAVAGKPAVPAYTAPKLLWIKAHESRRFAAARRVLLPKDYLRWRLTGTQATDPSDASNTLLFDVTRRRWSAQLTGALGLPASILPDVAEPAEVTGRVTARAAAATGLAAGVPVVGGAGDSITAAIANALVPGGPVLTVLGSAGNVSAVFAEPLIDPAGRIHTGCHAMPGTWIATGVQQAAGLALQWLRGLLAPGGDEAEASYAGSPRWRPRRSRAATGSPSCPTWPGRALPNTTRTRGARSPGCPSATPPGTWCAPSWRVWPSPSASRPRSWPAWACRCAPWSPRAAGRAAPCGAASRRACSVSRSPTTPHRAGTSARAAGGAAGQLGARGRDPRWRGVGPVRLAGRRGRAGPGLAIPT